MQSMFTDLSRTANERFRYGELLLMAILGLLQPFAEVLFGPWVASTYNVVAALIVLVYAVWRIVVDRGVLRQWGMRFDNFSRSLLAHLSFAAVAGVFIILFGWARGIAVPATFWFLLPIYFVWGFAQQFALQNMVARNLASLFPNVFFRALLVAACFGLVHLPSFPLAALSFVAGLFFIVLYDAFPNLFAVGIAHGLVGSLVFYVLLGQNQWRVVLGYFGL